MRAQLWLHSELDLEVETERNRINLTSDEFSHFDTSVEGGLRGRMNVPLEGSASKTTAVKTELPGVVSVDNLSTDLGSALQVDMIIEERSTGSTPLGLGGEEPVEVGKLGLLILIGNLAEESSSDLTIRSSPPGSKCTLVARDFEELTVNASANEERVSLHGELNLLLSVLLGSVKLLELDTLN